MYLTAPHPRFGPVCKELVYRVESKDIQGFIPHPIANEILHRLMIEEVIRSGNPQNGISALRYLKNKPEAIQHMTLAWDVFSVLRSIGFEFIPDSPETPDRTFHLSRTCHILAKDAAIAAIAQESGISHIATNDNDFARIPFLTIWKP